MRKLSVTSFLSLDGVMQAPGSPDEDRSGGWMVPYADEELVSAAALSPVEQSALSLDSPVDQCLPEFRPAAPSGESARITVRNLLTHTAGLDYRFQQPLEGPYTQANVSDGFDQPGLQLHENLRRIAGAPLVTAPDVGWRYSVAIDVLGAVMERAAGTTLPEIVAERVASPLGMDDTSLTVETPVAWQRRTSTALLVPHECRTVRWCPCRTRLAPGSSSRHLVSWTRRRSLPVEVE